MHRSAGQAACLMASLPACLMIVVLSGGCAGESQTVSGSQEISQPVPPPPPPPEPPPPPPKQEEMVAQAATPPEDPLAWAADLADVHFAYNQAAIRKEDQAALDALAHKLKEDSTRRILVEGHCDSRGTANYNLMLGERRAKAVKQYLVKAGVPEAQIEIVSYGKERPLCTDMNDRCWQQNRRAHFTAR